MCAVEQVTQAVWERAARVNYLGGVVKVAKEGLQDLGADKHTWRTRNGDDHEVLQLSLEGDEW